MSLEQQRRSAQTFPYINYSLWKHLFCRIGISLIASILLSFSVFRWKEFLWSSSWFQSKYTGSLFCFFINEHCVLDQICLYASLSCHCASQEGWALACSPAIPSERGLPTNWIAFLWRYREAQLCEQHNQSKCTEQEHLKTLEIYRVIFNPKEAIFFYLFWFWFCIRVLDTKTNFKISEFLMEWKFLIFG